MSLLIPSTSRNETFSPGGEKSSPMKLFPMIQTLPRIGYAANGQKIPHAGKNGEVIVTGLKTL